MTEMKRREEMKLTGVMTGKKLITSKWQKFSLPTALHSLFLPGVVWRISRNINVPVLTSFP